MNSRTGCQIQRLLPALVLLLLALALLPQTAYVQGLAGPANPRPVTTGSGTIPQTSDPDCDLRPAGQKTLLLAHDEMALAYRANKQPNLAYSAIQEHERKLVWGSPSDFLNTDALSDIRWPSATMADLDGDGRQQIVMAFQDKYQRVATARPISIRPNEPPDYDLWYSDSANCQGKNVAWVGIAAGNLDGPWTQDHDDEVVVAFSDNNHGLHLFTLDKANLDRPNSRAAWYGDDATNGRGSVQYVAVATGDLDGDGYDNEIVTVFKDGNKDLQCVILQQRQGKQTLQVLWWRQWTTHDRHNIANDGFGQNFAHNTQPVDVTTGDVDGDFQDEVILTFRDNNGTCTHGQYQVYNHVQLLLLDYQGQDAKGQAVFDDRVFTDHDPAKDQPGPDTTSWANVWTPSVAVSAADLDLDGLDEIVVAYVIYSGWPGGIGRDYYMVVGMLVYDYVPPGMPEWQGCVDDRGDDVACLHQVTSAHHEYPTGDRIALVSGDLDRDGNVEVVLAYLVFDGDIRMTAYNWTPGFAQRSSLAANFHGQDQAQEFALALGDMNGDSTWGIYSGDCYASREMHITSVIHSPPYWSDRNAEDTKAGFGISVGHGGGTGQTTETKYGGLDPRRFS